LIEQQEYNVVPLPFIQIRLLVEEKCFEASAFLWGQPDSPKKCAKLVRNRRIFNNFFENELLEYVAVRNIDPEILCLCKPLKAMHTEAELARICCFLTHNFSRQLRKII